MLSPDDKNKAKRLIVEIIRLSGGEFRGQARLYKAFLFAHLYYFRRNPGFLSEWPIVHMPHGHGIEAGDLLIAELIASGTISTRMEECGRFLETVFVLSDEGSAECAFDANEIDAIREAVDFVSGKRASELSDLVHEYSTSYNEGESGQALNIYVDAFDDKWINSVNEQLRCIKIQTHRALL